MSEFSEKVRSLADNPEALLAAHISLEDLLVDMRDSRMCLGMPANGLVIRERDGSDSVIIRIGTRDAVRFALIAIADHLEKEESI